MADHWPTQDHKHDEDHHDKPDAQSKILIEADVSVDEEYDGINRTPSPQLPGLMGATTEPAMDQREDFVPERPDFAASFDIDHTINVPEYPAFAHLYTIDQVSNVPQYPAFASSNTIDQHYPFASSRTPTHFNAMVSGDALAGSSSLVDFGEPTVPHFSSCTQNDPYS